jgi:hypothetical protein
MKWWSSKITIQPIAAWLLLLAATASTLPQYRTLAIMVGLSSAGLAALHLGQRREIGGLLWLAGTVMVLAAFTVPIPLPPLASFVNLGFHPLLWGAILSMLLIGAVAHSKALPDQE